MEPLSLAASVIAVATLAGTTAKGFIKLRALHKDVPGRVNALHNEVTDLELVLRNIAAVVPERPDLTDAELAIRQLLERSRTGLKELGNVVGRLDLAIRKRVRIFQGLSWQKEHAHLETLQKELNSTKCSFNVLLGASNS